jgi:hypothetical protein
VESDSALRRAEAWLEAHPPDSLLSFSDRLLLRVLVPRSAPADRARLRRQSGVMVRACLTLARRGDLIHDATAALIILWALRRLRVPTVRLAAAIRASDLSPMLSAPEPYRSTFGYWARRAGLALDGEAGPPPRDPRLRAYHALHAIFFASDYGERRVSLPRVRLAVAGDADLLAETALAALALGRDPSALVRRLVAAQSRDGSFSPAPRASFDRRHHATCAAALILHRVTAGRVRP